MNIQRGDVIKARFPHASGGRGKKRPVVVVQADVYNQRLRHAVVAQITTNLDEKNDPAYLFVEGYTPEAKAAGLDRNCLDCCTLLSLMSEDRLKEKIGNLSAEMLTDLDDCLKAALGIGWSDGTPGGRVCHQPPRKRNGGPGSAKTYWTMSPASLRPSRRP